MNQTDRSRRTSRDKPLVLGHRGARDEVWENTLAGFAYAHTLTQRNAYALDGVELDVQLSADGALMVHHDDNLKRTCGKPWRIDQLSAQRLKQTPQVQLTTKHQTTALPCSECICTLADLVPHLQHYRHIELEVKTHARSKMARLLKALNDELGRDCYRTLPITLTSFDTTLLYKLASANLPFASGFLLERPLPVAQIIAVAKRLSAVRIGVHYRLINQQLVDLAHRHHLAVTAWTVNDQHVAQALCSMGVDCIITDCPSRFLRLSPWSR